MAQEEGSDGGRVDRHDEARSGRGVEQTRELFRALIQHSVDVIKVLDANGVTAMVSPQIEDRSGFTPNEVVGRPCAELMHPSDQETVRSALARCAEGIEDPVTVEARHGHRDGSWVWVELRAKNYLDEPAVRGLVVAERDVSARRAAETAAATGEARKAAILDASLDAIILMSAEGRVLEWNPRAEQVFGYRASEAVGRPVADLIVPPALRSRHREGLARYLETGEGRFVGTRVELDAVDSTGSELPVELALNVIGLESQPLFIAVIRDLREIREQEAERDQLRARLEQSERLGAVGQLAGGIAHDFNNLLSVMQNYTDFVLEEMPADDPRRADLEEVAGAARRAADLVRQLLLFSRREIARPEVIRLRDRLRDLEKLLRRSIPENIELHLSLSDVDLEVEIDPGQFDQVLLNLVVNARDSIEAGGSIFVDAGERRISETVRYESFEIPPGSYGVVSVSDTGAGILPEVLPHVFEPFFTTKPRGEGTGLGLATVYGIVKRFGGYITPYSEVGVGTTFSVYLPLARAAVEGPPEPSRPAPSKTGTDCRITVVEDETAVLRLVTRILERQGYEVAAFDDPQRAYERLSEGDKPDLLITDVIMPGMSGSELSQRTGLPTLFLSGYTGNFVTKQGLVPADVNLLQKPFTGEALLAAVEEVLF